MAKSKEENSKIPVGFMLDPQEEDGGRFIPTADLKQQAEEPVQSVIHSAPAAAKSVDNGLVNCLRNEKVIVRHIPRQRGIVTDPKHVLYGGMADNAIRRFSVPKLTSGVYVNVLTKAEKDYLEYALGLEPNQLSVYRKINNYWDDGSEGTISSVTLKKGDNVFDMSIPEDYIRVKILMANKEFIASSMKELQENPKSTYQFVIINEGDEVKSAKAKVTAMQRCYAEFGKIEEDTDTLRVIIETISGKPVAPNTKLDWLQGQINDMIQANCKLFLDVVTDELLNYKVTIKRAIEAGIIASRGNQLFVRDGNLPLCEYGEEPTLSIAAKYLSNPKHQDLLFAIQAKLKK